MNMIKSMLAGRGIPNMFWHEVVNLENYVINRIHTTSIQKITPEEAYSKSKALIQHFRIFGFIAYVHIPDVEMRTLDDKGMKCIFLGVSDTNKAYRIITLYLRK